MIPPRERLIALGASNLTRILPQLVDGARRRAGGPIEVLAACGLGRSFGITSRFLARVLPGIDTCGLWQHLAGAPALPTTAVVMDVGNDILYGVPVATILEWVDRVLARLRPHSGRLVLAGVPPGVAAIGPLRHWLIRRLLVPGCRVERAEGARSAALLDEGLGRLADRHGAGFVAMQGQWYGIDPLHLRRRCWPSFCGRILGGARTPAAPRLLDLGRHLRLRLAAPAHRTLLGRERQVAQPSLRWPDGTSVSSW